MTKKDKIEAKRKLINSWYSNLENGNSIEIERNLQLIIQTKYHCPALIDIKQTLYLDFKEYYSLRLKSIEFKEYGYDNSGISILVKHIDILPFNQRLSILAFLKDQFSKNGMPDHGVMVERIIVKTKFIYTCKQFSLKKLFDRRYIFDLFFTLSTVNIWGLISVSFFIYTILFTITYPLKEPILKLFEVTLSNQYSNNILNHGMKTLEYIFGLDSDYISTSGILSVIILILFKIVIAILILGYGVNKIINSIFIK